MALSLVTLLTLCFTPVLDAEKLPSAPDELVHLGARLQEDDGLTVWEDEGLPSGNLGHGVIIILIASLFSSNPRARRSHALCRLYTVRVTAWLGGEREGYLQANGRRRGPKDE